MENRGRLITFEGVEGSGKSTLVQSIATRLMDRGRKVCVTREPGATDFGAKIRAILLEGGDIPAKAELFLFLADRANHIEQVILPALAHCEIVLCDRFTDSTLVYQCFARGLDEQFVREGNQFATNSLTPDLTLLLDVDPETGIARQKNVNRLDREPMLFHKRVRAGFLKLASEEPRRIQLIDASREIDLVFRDSWLLIEQFIL